MQHCQLVLCNCAAWNDAKKRGIVLNTDQKAKEYYHAYDIAKDETELVNLVYNSPSFKGS